MTEKDAFYIAETLADGLEKELDEQISEVEHGNALYTLEIYHTTHHPYSAADLDYELRRFVDGEEDEDFNSSEDESAIQDQLREQDEWYDYFLARCAVRRQEIEDRAEVVTAAMKRGDVSYEGAAHTLRRLAQKQKSLE